MARIKLVPTEQLTPGMQKIAKAAAEHKLNPRIFQAAGNLPEAYEAFWAFLRAAEAGGAAGGQAEGVGSPKDSRTERMRHLKAGVALCRRCSRE